MSVTWTAIFMNSRRGLGRSADGGARRQGTRHTRRGRDSDLVKALDAVCRPAERHVESDLPLRDVKATYEALQAHVVGPRFRYGYRGHYLFPR
jgi:hypothetical protein